MTEKLIPLGTVAGALALVLLAGSAVEQWIPGTRERLDGEVLSAPSRRVTVDVRNGGGVPGVARTATERLRAIGYDVVRFGNDDAFDLDSSVVVDRIDDLEMAAAVAQALGILTVRSDPDPNLFVDVTVRLGADWTADPPPSDEGGRGAVGRWWRRVLPER